MEQRSGSGVNWFNYRDTAWKQAIISLAAAFVDFFFPETAKMMNRDLEISCTFEKTLHAQGAISSLGERRVDVLFDVPLLGEEPSSKIIFIEQQELKDLLMNLRCFEILILLLGMYFGSKIDGLVLCTGYENEGDYLTHELKAEHSRVKADIRTINLSSFKLKALENDDRVFALILYIALLEKLGGQEPARREESARKALKHLKGKNLSPKVMSACCLFAFILMRLDDAAINRELREDFKMFIIEHD
ncbi:MAG: hypothetical protein LBR53_07755, partial [Deltaproteobacteria bacterium]|nr:hypothetical protein [Deltaproteobacteria bacterium]